MSANPVTITVSPNPGTPLPIQNSTCLFGICSSGTAATPALVGSVLSLTSTYGQGPLVDAAAQYLQITGQPVYVCRVAQTSAGTMGSVTKVGAGSGTGTVSDNSSVPVNKFSFVLVVTTSGTVAAGTFKYKYSTDGGNNYSAITSGPTNGSGSANVSLGTTGVSITFADGGGPTTGYVAGDVFTWETTWPTYSTGNLTTAVQALIDSPTIRVRRIHAAGTNGASFHATLISLAGTTAFNAYKYFRALEESDDQGSGESVSTWQAGVLTDFATQSNRVVVIAGWQQTLLQTQQDGVSQQRTVPIAWSVGPRIAAIDLSQDPGQSPSISGPLPNTVVDSTYPIRQDGRLYTAFEGQGVSYGQSYVGLAGLYSAGAFTRVANSSDVYYWLARCQVIDLICEQLYQGALQYINTNQQANADGTIAEQAAQAIESSLNQLVIQSVVNTSPQRISPDPNNSYVTVDRTNNIVTSGELRVTVTVTPRAFVRTVNITIGYALASAA
jgi:hypothetical protein